MPKWLKHWCWNFNRKFSLHILNQKIFSNYIIGSKVTVLSSEVRRGRFVTKGNPDYLGQKSALHITKKFQKSVSIFKIEMFHMVIFALSVSPMKEVCSHQSYLTLWYPAAWGCYRTACPMGNRKTNWVQGIIFSERINLFIKASTDNEALLAITWRAAGTAISVASYSSFSLSGWLWLSSELWRWTSNRPMCVKFIVLTIRLSVFMVMSFIKIIIQQKFVLTVSISYLTTV